MTTTEHTSAQTAHFEETAFSQLSQLYRWQNDTGYTIQATVPESEAEFNLVAYPDWDHAAFRLAIRKERAERAFGFFLVRAGNVVTIHPIEQTPSSSDQLPEEDLDLILHILPAAIERQHQIQQSPPKRQSFLQRLRS